MKSPPHQPLRLLLLARDLGPRVQNVKSALERSLRACAGIELLDVISGDIDRPPRFAQPPEIAVVLGGDGAILRACRLFGTQQIPLLGVNLGRLGFLADLLPDDFQENLHRLRDRQFTVVQHLMFECEHHHADGTCERYLGLNEVIVASGGSLTMLDVSLAIDEEPVTTFSGDGLIISTPVGSTAHSLSAGGPILRQELQAFVVTPICPHALTNRPLVDGANVRYTLTVPDVQEGVMLVIDGQIKVPIREGDRVVVARADVTFPLVRLPGHSFYGSLHRKLGWSGQPRYLRRNDG